ncbi:Dph6-related ATP pyrophosphatase [Budvicia aquatica]|uniref:ATP-binding protein n=1 Tax=Budvicia aquatica TaxID=82979 RepID=A0A2C6DNR8_9GAMM|nr:hypothetical protein [Budvicia aquatica]PHI30343.1 ATP-binding protein [Budvicia aquatica]VFS49446.1 MJ0570-related uncharacterized domain [Budvicia aquatica]
MIIQPQKRPIMVATSGGKDATLALHRLRYDPRFNDYQPVGLMTMFDANTGRSTAHNIRREVIQAQADALGLPLHIIELEDKRGHAYADYDEKVGRFCLDLVQQGISHIMYGDIHLEDVKAYRENLNQQSGIQGVYPLWGSTPEQITEEFLALGYKTSIVAVDSTRLTSDYLGMTIDNQLLDNLPAGVDRCAEYGEYHTFCTDGPMFSQAVKTEKGEVWSDGRNEFITLTL